MDELKERILYYLEKSQTPWTTKELTNALGVEFESVSDCLVKMLDRGEVEEMIHTENICGLGRSYICYWTVPGVFGKITEEW